MRQASVFPNGRTIPFVNIMCAVACLLGSLPQSVPAVAQSAVVTLQLPPGARATGLGEGFTGLADDANAAYFNPAGLGLTPLAHTWKSYSLPDEQRAVVVACKSKKEFAASEKVWVGTATGLLRYNGQAWEYDDKYLIEADEDLETIVKKIFVVEDEPMLRQAIDDVREANGIEMERQDGIVVVLEEALTDSARKSGLTPQTLARRIIALPASERSYAKIFGLLAASVDSSRADALAGRIDTILQQEDVEMSSSALLELKIPFSIAVKESVTALLYDETDVLWAGTAHGLWRYENSVWTRLTVRDGLPSNAITAIAARETGLIVIGTKAGVGVLQNGAWKTIALPAQATDSAVTAVAVSHSGTIYAGSNQGLFMYRDSTWSFFDTAKGLVGTAVTALYCDETGALWIGGDNGITLWDEKSWKRYKFGQSRTSSFAPYADGSMWIGTNRGAILYTPGLTEADQDGNPVQAPPQWKAYHNKNALSGNEITSVAVQDRDVWIGNEGGLDRFDHAERQAELFYEMLLPETKLPDLWHSFGALVWPTEEWGTVGLYINFANFGSYEVTDEFGTSQGQSRAWEGIFALNYGFAIAPDFGLGLNAKYVYSMLARDAIGQTFAVDAGLLKRNLLLKGFDLGVGLFNMGPAIYYTDPNQPEPIPFTGRVGMCYRAIQTPVYDLKFIFDFYREIVKSYIDRKPDPFYQALYTSLINDPDEHWRDEVRQVQYSVGMEFWYINMLAIRVGGLIDPDGQRRELTPGVGIRYGNINFDWSYIYTPKGDQIRNGQMRYSFIFRF